MTLTTLNIIYSIIYRMEKPIEDDLEETTTDVEEAQTPQPKNKRVYVMTEKRKLALERMKEGRARKADESRQRKANDAKILEKGRKDIEKKKKKQIIVYESESSSEDEKPVVIKRRKKPVKSPILEEKEEIVEKVEKEFRLKRL
jgi:hypothetical protein